MVNKSELLYVVDEYDVAIPPRPRHETHALGLWHRTAHIWIINDKKQLICQKRSINKDQYPGLWEPFVGGHIGPGDDYFAGAVKEVIEETGIIIEKKDLNLIKIYKDHETREYRGVFYYKWNGNFEDIISEPEEVDEVRLVDLNTIKRYLLSSKLNTWSRTGYEEEVLSILHLG